MKISIITVTYNSEETLQKTIDSVLSQENPGTYEVEYIFIDGASKDGTVKRLEQNKETLSEKGIRVQMVSEPDHGIYDAMNKGIRLATGDVIGILNSGDWYEPDTLKVVQETFEKKDCELMFANIRMYRSNGETFVKKARLRGFQTSRDWNHPTTFVKAALYKDNPFRDLGIHDDYGFYLQMRKQERRIVTVDRVLANFPMGGASNHKSLKACKKRIRDRYRYCYRINGYSRFYFLECVAIEAAKYILG